MLVDVLAFYISCERAFQATLHRKPTIVVGSNDHILVAVSSEAKKLGLFRGQPLFQCEYIVRKHQVNVLSSNFSLYDSMSKRLMLLLREYAPNVEEYSIDESFCELSSQGGEDLLAFGKVLQSRALKWLGLPVRVCFAPSKVLAKAGSVLLKANESYHDIIDLTSWTEQQLTEALASIQIEEVFGIGAKYAQMLRNYGISNALQLRDASEQWVKQKLTVVGARIQAELKGISCFPLQTRRKPKQQIIYSKTFGRPISKMEELEEAISHYTAQAAIRLREQDSLAGRITVFVSTLSFDPLRPSYGNDFTLNLRYPSAFTPTLLGYAQQGARAIYREAIPLKKAGVVLGHIVPLPAVQLDLFGEQSLIDYYQEGRL